MFNRMADGTGVNGHINWKWDRLNEEQFCFSFDNEGVPPLAEVYQVYGVCEGLYVSLEKYSQFGELPPLYLFLYGQPVEAVLNDSQQDCLFSQILEIGQKRWTKEKVELMNWDWFCLSYYTFLFSRSDFRSKIWTELSSILNVLRENPSLLSARLRKYKSNTSTSTDTIFWETVYDGLYKKVISQLRENRCYNDYVSLQKVKAFLPETKYILLERECCTFFDRIARARIENACTRAYSVSELRAFDIEELFFYKEYFSMPSACKETKQYVTTAVFTLLNNKGDKIRALDEFKSADEVYAAAMKFAQTSFEKEAVENKRSAISQGANNTRSDTDRPQAAVEKKQKKGLTRIVLGCLLILFQIISISGNAKYGNAFPSVSFVNTQVFFYSALTLLSYLCVGIIGAILLISGICAANKAEKTINGDFAARLRRHKTEETESLLAHAIQLKNQAAADTSGIIEERMPPKEAPQGINAEEKTAPTVYIDTQQVRVASTAAPDGKLRVKVKKVEPKPSAASICASSGLGADTNVASREVPSVEHVIAGMPEVRFCRRCGFKLLEGSVFCSQCGFNVAGDFQQL